MKEKRLYIHEVGGEMLTPTPTMIRNCHSIDIATQPVFGNGNRHRQLVISKQAKLSSLSLLACNF